MEKEQIISLYEGGQTCREIAKQTSVCYDTIHNWLIKWGVETRKRGPRWKKYPDPKHRSWQRGIERLYGITEADYLALLEKQGGVCAVCKEPPQGKLCVDHVHDETKRVRGLLCTPCNQATGLLKDSPTNVLNLHTYLTQ
jgi:hypothetical protein